MVNDRRRHRGKLLFLMSAGAMGIVLLVIGSYQLVEFSDSTAFCGQLCHEVMYPEYTAYQASPHSRVNCSHCHVGSGADYLVRSKLTGIPLIFTTLTRSYDRPIPTPVQNLRPASETCEQCHRPEYFTGDLVRVHTTYLTDEANTAKVDTRILRVGGGELEVARDTHWHIGANVYYLALDQKRIEIAWVGVETNNGELTEYIDPERAAEVTTERIDEEKRLMDCMDCHNRATHIFRSPGELIDTALTQGQLDSSLPYLKRESLKALDPANSSLAEAFNKIEAIREFYHTSYPQIYSSKQEAINHAITVLQEIARLTTFPDMKVTWNTYADNIGHTGCFRCHSKLIATSGSQKDQVINADCNLCHYLELP